MQTRHIVDSQVYHGEGHMQGRTKADVFVSIGPWIGEKVGGLQPIEEGRDAYFLEYSTGDYWP